MVELLIKYSSLINVFASILLLIVTAIYVVFTKKILDVSRYQANMSQAPSIGIRIIGISISKVFGPKRRNMSIELELVNVGNAPAIEILVDSEVYLSYSNIKGERIIPARFEPSVLSFLTHGEKFNDCNQNFGNKFIVHFLDDVRESMRLNMHRIETDPTQESYKTSRLHIFCYYRNSIGQYFKSSFSTEIALSLFSRDAELKNDEMYDVSMLNIPRPCFHIEPIKKDIMEEEIDIRNKKRDLCGW